MVLQQFYMIHNINIIRSICFFFHWIFFRNSLLIKINIVSTTSFGQRSIWQVPFFFFFCQKHNTTTELVINQQAPTLVWWHCFFLILMLPEPYLSMRCPDGVVFVSLFPSPFFQKYFPPHYSSDHFLLKPCSTLLYKYIYMVVERSILVKKLVVDIYVFYLITI